MYQRVSVPKRVVPLSTMSQYSPDTSIDLSGELFKKYLCKNQTK